MPPEPQQTAVGRASARASTPGAESEPARAPVLDGDHAASPSTALRSALGHVPLVLAGLVVLAVGSTALALAWCVVSRLAYVGFVGRALRAESRRAAHPARDRNAERAETAWRRFRDVAARIMLGDALALVVLCIVTRGTLDLGGPAWLATSLVLIAVGLGVKFWASASLDAGTFYWRDFFVPPEHRSLSAAGPYRWLSDPMYSVGYAHAYGFALLLGSGPGLAGAAFAQLAVLLLARLVERPHLLRLVEGGSVQGGSAEAHPPAAP